MILHAIILAAVLALVGCGAGLPPKFLHEPALATNVPQIVKGQTTKEEVLEYFGMPDIEAHGAHSKVSSNMALILMYKDPKQRIPMVADNIGVEGLFPYSSIDDEHIAFVYLEHCVNPTTETFVPVVNVGTFTSYQFFNRLLIFIDKATGLVDEFAFREEFEARCDGRPVGTSPTHTVCYGPIVGAPRTITQWCDRK